MPKKKSGKGPSKSGHGASGASDRAAEKRVARLRDKLTDAMRDPLTREQIVRAIRAMMQEK